MIIEVKKDNIELLDKLEKNFYSILGYVLKDFMNNPFTRYLVYLEDGKILGYLNYYQVYNRYEIANFNVLEEYQNQGIGTKLLEYLIQMMHDIENITLEVRVDNEKAIHLYQKMGFKIVAKREGYYQGIDGILMERSGK